MSAKVNKNPLEGLYRGRKIYKYPTVYLRVSVWEMKKFIDLEIDVGLSAKEAIKSKKIWCTDCKDTSVKKFNGND